MNRPQARPNLLPDQTPPHAFDAEQIVIGSALISTPATEKLLSRVERQDFYMEAHRRYFDAIAALRAKAPPAPVDTFTTADEMTRQGHFEATGGIVYLNELVNAVPTTEHVDHYINIVLEMSARRRLIASADFTISEANDVGRPVEQVLAEAEERLVSVLARRSHQQGPRVMDVVDLLATNFPPPVWIVEGLLPVGVCVLAGPVKARKSFWALCVALALAAGKPALGSLPAARCATLCVFLEDRFPEVKERIEQLIDQSGSERGWLTIAEEWPRMDEGGEAWLSRWLTQHPEVKFVVLDPLVRVRGGRLRAASNRGGRNYEDDYEDMEAFKRIVDRHGVCLLVLHHTRKLPADDWVSGLLGSTALAGAADAIMLLQLERGQADAVLRATGRRVRNQERAQRWDDHSGWNDFGDAEMHAKTREQEEVVECLSRAGGPMKLGSLVAAICEMTGAKDDAVKKRVSRMADRGQIMREAGLYWLPAGVRPGTNERTSKNESENGVPPVPLSLSAISRHETSPENGDTPLSPECPQLNLEVGTEETLGTPETEQTDRTPETRGTAGTPGTDIAPNPENTALRLRVRLLAMEQGFPELTLGDGEGQTVKGTETFWSRFCQDVAPEWIRLAERALEARGAQGAG